jgi:arabinose-5-phosphate isomerase
MIDNDNDVLVDEQRIILRGLNVLETEALAITDLTHKIDHSFVNAARVLLGCTGRVVVTGMGKSGHIARKIAATMASTGTPTFFLHPAEASHGDLGMLTKQDVLLTLSNSGETEEILCILPLVKRLGIPIISMTGNPDSTLAKHSTAHLNVSVQKEACPLGLAPTASTTAALAMGDALALAVLEARGFTAEDFAQSHPRGRLGKRLLLKIDDIMHKGPAVPRVPENAKLAKALMEMTQKRLGFTTIVAEHDPEHLLGIFTDGDLRRTFEKGINIHETPISDVMTKNCKTMTIGALASEALHLMEKIKSFDLPVLDNDGKLVGALNLHDLLRAGVL